MSAELSLPLSWVERIWDHMRATYGATFDRQWETPAGSDPSAHVQTLKAHWARGLGGFVHCPDALRYGLDNLGQHPPNLIEFRALCNRRPDPVALSLPAPPADPARVAALVSQIKPPTEGVSARRQCIANIKAAAERATLTRAQREMLKTLEALE